MNADAVAVYAADRLVGRLLFGATVIAQHELIGGQADRLADRSGRHALGQGGRRGFGGLLRR